MKKVLFLLLAATYSNSFGQGNVQPFELLNVADGKPTTVKNCQACQGVVVIFTSLKCPYDQHYQDRIKALKEKYDGKISFFLINASLGAEEDEIKMKTAYENWGIPVPYLSDKKQIALKALNATRTPEAILLKPEGSGLTIIYQGAIDDNPQVHHDTSKDFLDDAIHEFISGKPVTVPTERVVGCIVRKGS